MLYVVMMLIFEMIFFSYKGVDGLLIVVSNGIIFEMIECGNVCVDCWCNIIGISFESFDDCDFLISGFNVNFLINLIVFVF